MTLVEVTGVTGRPGDYTVTATPLEAALRAGLTIDCECREGSCGRYRTRAISGRAKAVHPSSADEVDVPRL